MMIEDIRPLAVVTGASSGIGYELARLAVEDGYDLVIAADEPAIVEAKTGLEQHGGGLTLCRWTYRPPRAWTN
jgi:NAD(P)-dependent dehydrogenase (short-subunit alcohol dehydrogenase family)